ncbi:hypothetical protein DSUL_170054 [Desulfovibrionales bacterium]
MPSVPTRIIQRHLAPLKQLLSNHQQSLTAPVAMSKDSQLVIIILNRTTVQKDRLLSSRI